MTVSVIGDAFIDIIVPLGGIKPGETHYRKVITLCDGTTNAAVQIAKLGEVSKLEKLEIIRLENISSRI